MGVEARVGKFNNGKAAGKDEVTGNRSFHCTRVKERGQNAAIMKVLAC